MSGSRSMPLPALGAFAIATALVLGVAAHAETADDRRMRQLAGQSQSYTGEVRALLARGADPNVPGDSGRTAVHAAAMIGAAETLRVLLEAGGDPNRRDDDGYTPLHLAAGTALSMMIVGDSIASIRVLLRGGAGADAADRRGRTALHLAAAWHDRPGGVAALAGAGADPNRRDRDGATPLHVALGDLTGWLPVVGALLEGGADPRVTDGGGLTALQLYVKTGGQRAVAAMLIDAGADPDRRYGNGEAPLHVAARGEKAGLVEALLAGGADPCVRDAKRAIPYHFAREGGAARRTLDRADGYDFACDRRERQIAEVDRAMRAAKRSNVRSGPGTEHDKVGLLEVGDEVRVTGEAGDWLRIETPDGEAFVHASLLEQAGPKVALSPKCAELGGGYTDENDAACWEEMQSQPGCYAWNGHYHSDRVADWTGSCPGGVASGRGTYSLTAGSNHGGVTTTGTFAEGKKQGRWVEKSDNGTVAEGSYVDGARSGRWTFRYASGSVTEAEGSYMDGKLHGPAVERFKSGARLEQEFRNHSRDGQPGVYVTSGGDRHPGRWSDGCFLDDDGYPWAWVGGKSKDECLSQ